MMSRRAVGLLLAAAFGLSVCVGSAPAQTDGPPVKGLGQGKRAQEFLAAFNKGLTDLQTTGDLGGEIYPNTLASELLGWRPQGR